MSGAGAAEEALARLRRGEVWRARDAIDAAPDGAFTRCVRGRVSMAAGELDAAERDARAALAEASRPPDVAHALFLSATLAARNGRTADCDALLHRLERIPPPDLAFELDAQLLRNEWLGQAGRVEEARAPTLALLERVRAEGQVQTLVIAELAAATELRRHGEHGRAAALLSEAELHIRREGWEGLRARWLASRATFPHPDESLAEQAEWLEEAFELTERCGERARGTVVMNNLATRLLALDRVAEAVTWYERAVPRADPRHHAFLGCALQEALRRAGRHAEADARVEELLARTWDTVQARVQVQTAALTLHLRRGDRDAWRAALGAALPTLTRPFARNLLLLAVEAAEERPDATEEAAFLAAIALEGGGPVDAARVERLARSGAPVPLGPHVLLGPIGQGGMGTVWRARHVPSGELRALKTVPPAADPGAARALEREARALALIDHPHVVPILDRGVAGRATELASGGAIPAGTTWLAMPLARRSVQDVCGRVTWEAARTVLLAVLDGLAQAHAHGLLHLDVKPANILLDGDEPPYVAHLADFGLARPERERDRTVAGTPQFMAPEQFRRQWREWGPWTDLYALGATAVAILQGAPPFDSTDPAELAAAHLHRERPRLRAATPVPEGIEAWLDRMMARSPLERFASATEAADALGALGPPVVPAAPGPATSPVDPRCTFEWVDEGVESVPEPPTPSPAAPTRPGVPANWRTESVFRESNAPGLLALRQIELAGREVERDALWSALRAVDAEGAPRVVLLRGARGMGIRRMLRWLEVRVRSLGVAAVASSPIDGRDALVGLLRAEDASGDALRAHLAGTVRRPPSLPVELAARALEQGDPDAIAEALACAARDRPLLVVHPGASRPLEVLDVVERVLARPGRVLLALALPEADLVERAELAARLSALAEHPRWTEVRVAPLDRSDVKRILSGSVDLDPDLLERLADRARGNPGYAMALLRSWDRGGHLTPALRGLRVSEFVEAQPPPSELERWEPVIERLPTGVARALAALAVLGPATWDQWAQACAEAGWTSSEADRAAGVAAAWVHPVGDTWQIAAPGLCDVLLRRLDREGERPRAHEAAARVLAGSTDPAGLAARGEHLVAAGRPDEAIAPLSAAARDTVDSGRALAVLGKLERALVAAGLGDDPRWLDARGRALERRLERGDVEEVRALLPGYAARAASEPDHAWRAAWLEAMIAEDPLPLLDALFGRLPEDATEARARVAHHAAWITLERGDRTSAVRWIARAPGEHPSTLGLASELARREGRADDALVLAEAAAARVDPTLPWSPSVWFQLGDLRRDRGDLEGAEADYRRARDLARRRDDPLAVVGDVNLLVLRVLRGQRPTPAEVRTVRRGVRHAGPAVELATRLLELLVLPAERLRAAVDGLLTDLPPENPELLAIARGVLALRPDVRIEAVVARLAPP